MMLNPGFLAVPIVPTAAMLDAGEKAVYSRPVHRAERVWGAMLKAMADPPPRDGLVAAARMVFAVRPDNWDDDDDPDGVAAWSALEEALRACGALPVSVSP